MKDHARSNNNDTTALMTLNIGGDYSMSDKQSVLVRMT